MRRAGELQVRAADPLRELDAALEVAFGVREPGGPQFGDAEVDERQCVQVFPRTWPAFGQGSKLRSFLGHGRQVPALAG